MTKLATKYSQYLRPELHSMLKDIDNLPAGTSTPGTPGLPGANGSPGVGVPAGGSAGQILAKINSTDYNTEWENIPHELPIGGTVNQVLAKIDGTDYNVQWVTQSSSGAGGWNIDGGVSDFIYSSFQNIDGGPANSIPALLFDGGNA